MSGVLVGFTAIAAVIALGYLLGRRGTLGPHGQQVLSRLVFTVGTPALLFTTLVEADLRTMFSASLLVATSGVAISAGLYVVIARGRLGLSGGETTIGALTASYVNAGNLGIPIAVYVLGDASYVAPIMLLQMAVIGPIALTILEFTTADRSATRWRQLLLPFRNPNLVASALGLVVALTGVELPDPPMQPVLLVAGLAVPGALLAFGISLHGAPLPGRGELRWAVWSAVAIKLLVQPLLAYLVATFVLSADSTTIFAVTVMAALPTAQNVFVFASRYNTGVMLAREAIVLSSVLSAVAITVIAALLSR